MLALGPLARRAEDLMPVLRIVAGPDGDRPAPARSSSATRRTCRLDGLPVVLAEDTSCVPVRRELRDAREQAAGALVAAGASVRRVSLRSMRRALELYLAALRAGADKGVRELLEEETEEAAQLALGRVGWARCAAAGRTPLPMVILLATEALAARIPERRDRRALAAGEGAGAGGRGRHRRRRAAPPAPRRASRRATGAPSGAPWVVTPTAVFNLLGLPVTQVPLGLNARRPAARRPGRGRAGPRPRRDRRRARARARLRRLGSAAGLKRRVSSGRQRGSGQGDRGDPGDDSDETGHFAGPFTRRRTPPMCHRVTARVCPGRDRDVAEWLPGVRPLASGRLKGLTPTRGDGSV